MSKTSIEKIRVKKEMLDLLQDIMTMLADKETEVSKEYKNVGKTDKQRTNWKTGELMWEDEEKTIPLYEDNWEYVDKEELTENDKARIEAINQIRTTIEKLV